MTLEEKIQEVLLADAGVIAITSTRVKVGFVGQSLDMPYISHIPVANDEYRMHQGRGGMQFWIYQVGCFAATYQAARDLAIAVMAALQDYRSGGIIVTRATYGPHIYEDPERVHQQVLEFSIADAL